MSTNMVRNNPMIMAAIQKNILEHISIMAQEQVQLEFREQIAQMMHDATDKQQQIHRFNNSYKCLQTKLKQEKQC